MNDPHNEPGPTAREREQLFTALHIKALLVALGVALGALSWWAFRT